MANKENILKWVEALESGEYPQTQGALQNLGGFCCLGVACDVAVQNEVIPEGEHTANGCVIYDGNSEYLPERVVEWLGLPDGNPEVFVTTGGSSFPTSLVGLNDNYEWDFAHIAKAIRENYLED